MVTASNAERQEKEVYVSPTQQHEVTTRAPTAEG